MGETNENSMIEDPRSSLHSVKLRNRQMVLSFMRANSKVSVGQISRTTGISKMTIHKILAHYLAEGLVVHAGKGNSTEEGGKKPNLFAFNAHSRYLFAGRIAGRTLTAAIANLRGELVSDKKVYPMDTARYGEAVTMVGSAFRDLLAANSLSHERIVAMVVGCNGIVEADGKEVLLFDFPEWGPHLPLKESLRIMIPSSIPIYIDCWWRYIAFAEAQRRIKQGNGTFFFFGNCGDHIAGGLVVDGNVFRGQNGFAGELGQLTMPGCDRSGGQGSDAELLEASVSPSAVLTRAREMRAEHPHSLVYANNLEGGLADIGAAADRGDDLGVNIMDNVAGSLAAAFRNIAIMCDPGTFVLFGTYTGLGEYFRNALIARLAEARFYGIDNKCALEYSDLEEKDGIVGAATFITDSLYTQT